MHSGQTKNHPKAFSLIEVLFAVLLLSVVLFGVIRLEISQFRLSETQKNEIQAYSLAHQNIEKIVALGKTVADSACNTEKCRCQLEAENLNCSENAQEVSDLFTQYFWLENTGLINAWRVSSVVEWEDGTGQHTQESGGAALVKRILY